MFVIAIATSKLHVCGLYCEKKLYRGFGANKATYHYLNYIYIYLSQTTAWLASAYHVSLQIEFQL